MTNEYTLSLKEAIDELQAVAKQCQSADSIDMHMIEAASQKSHQLLLRINDAALLTNNMLLRELISKLLFVITQLHNLAVEEEKNMAPPPHELLAIITSGFESFFNTIMSKKRQEVFKKIAEFVPCVGSVVHCCETMPYYWGYASRSEKAAMILGATLIIAALATTIACYASPALAGIFVLGIGIMAMCKIGSIFYRHAIVGPEKKYEDHQKLKDTVNALQEQRKGVGIMAKKIFTESKLEKESQEFQKQFVDPDTLKIKPRVKTVTKERAKVATKGDIKITQRSVAESKPRARFPAKLQFSIDGQALKTKSKARQVENSSRRVQNQKGW